jgi:uncharacterized protein (TIGR02757 family)
MDASSDLTLSELKEFLDQKATLYEQPNFIQEDPICLAHRFSQKEDIEIVAFLVSTISWGKRSSIIKSGERLLDILGPEPLAYVLNYKDGAYPTFIHRTFNQVDLNGFLLGLKHCYENGGLEAAFEAKTPKVYDRIMHFREIFTPFLQARSQKHVANPNSGSAAKRLIMFLRWMSRPAVKGVDFGIWPQHHLPYLMIPLDVHTGNISRKLGLLKRSQNDWKANEELYEQCVALDPTDPAKYDFALFGLGVYENF